LESQISGLQSEVTTLDNENTALESQVETLQSEKASLENDNSNLESQVSSLQSEVATLNNEKSMLESQVSSLQSEVTTLENEKTTLESQVSNLQSEITSLEDEVIQSYNTGYAEGEAEGYQLGYDEGYTQGLDDGAGTGYTIRDPTYSEAIAFMNMDQTDKNEYTQDYYCLHFTADFENNAFQAGYRCGFVYIEFTSSAHAIVCFNTTDAGLIFIEPQLDMIVVLVEGESYSELNGFAPSVGDTIQQYVIIW
jgi:cell division protein FtsB